MNLEPVPLIPKSLEILNSSSTVPVLAHWRVAFEPATNKSLAPENLLSIETVVFEVIIALSAGVGTAISQIEALDQSPVPILLISVAVLETNEILSIAAGGIEAAPVPLVQTKIKRKVVPAKLGGINAVCFVVPTWEV